MLVFLCLLIIIIICFLLPFYRRIYKKQPILIYINRKLHRSNSKYKKKIKLNISQKSLYIYCDLCKFKNLSDKGLCIFFEDKYYETKIIDFRIVFIILFNEVDSYIHSIKDIKHKNQELKKEKNILLNLINESPQLIWTRDKNHRINFFNKAYSNLLEAKILQSAAENQNIMDINPGIDHSIISKKTFYQNVNNIDINNKIYNIKILEKNINNELKLGYGFILEKIDRSKQNELQNSRIKYKKLSEYYYKLLKYLPIAIAIFDSQQKLTFFNKAFLQIWNISYDFCNFKPSYSKILDHLKEKKILSEQIDFDNFKKQELKIFSSINEINNKFYHLDNKHTIHITVIANKNGELLFIYNDITDKIILKKNYDISVKTHYTTLNNLQEGICVFDLNSRLKLFNNRFIVISRISEENLYQGMYAAKTLEYFLAKNPKLQGFEHKIILNKIIDCAEYATVLQNGENFWHLHVFPLPDSSSLLKITDITAQKTLESNLKQENKDLQELAKMKNKFFSSISNEIKTPITSIKGFSEMLQQGMCGTLTKKQKNYIANIHNEISLLNNMINNILYINLIESGIENIQYIDINCHELIKITKQILETYLQKNIIIINDQNQLLSINKEIYEQSLINICLFLIRNVNKTIASISMAITLGQGTIIQSLNFKLQKTIDENIDFTNNIHIDIAKKLINIQNSEITTHTQSKEIKFKIIFY